VGNIHDPSREKVKAELRKFKQKYVEMALRYQKPGAYQQLKR
jgi:hypothetical protein